MRLVTKVAAQKVNYCNNCLGSMQRFVQSLRSFVQVKGRKLLYKNE